LHWWEGALKIEPRAALYELARRHPLVHKTWTRNYKANARQRIISPLGSEENWASRCIRPPNNSGPAVPASLYWTCYFGFKSWAQLNDTDRRNWEISVGFLKGLDFRDEEMKCRSIRELADWKIRCDRKSDLGDKMKGLRPGKETGKVINMSLIEIPPTAADWESAIAYRAVEAFRQGYVLLAVSADLAGKDLNCVVSKTYYRDVRRYLGHEGKGRARWEDWLPLLSEFENAETGNNGAKAQLFARYRRLSDAIHFA
jgi:hypothetical protein